MGKCFLEGILMFDCEIILGYGKLMKLTQNCHIPFITWIVASIEMLLVVLEMPLLC